MIILNLSYSCSEPDVINCQTTTQYTKKQRLTACKGQLAKPIIIALVVNIN